MFLNCLWSALSGDDDDVFFCPKGNETIYLYLLPPNPLTGGEQISESIVFVTIASKKYIYEEIPRNIEAIIKV